MVVQGPRDHFDFLRRQRSGQIFKSDEGRSYQGLTGMMGKKDVD